MGNLLINSTRPSVINYNGNDVKKVVYNGVVVWEKIPPEGVKITSESFSLATDWRCSVAYYYNSTGSYNSHTQKSQGDPPAVTHTVNFPVNIPAGATIRSAKVHVTRTTQAWTGDTFTINGITPDANGFVTLSNPTVSSGKIRVTFEWKANMHSNSQHSSSEKPTYNGNSSQTKSFSHSAITEVTDVYMLVTY